MTGQLLGVAQSVGVTRHHRFILSLCHLVLAQVKAFRERHIMLIFPIRISTRLRRRATHRKGAWRTPDHIHRHGGIQIHGAVAHVIVTVRVVVAVLPASSCTV